VVAVGPGVAWGADGDARAAGWSASTVRFEPLTAGPAGVTVAGTGSFRGVIEVRRNGRVLSVGNHVALEDYVRGIDEVPPSWPAAALQAQAVAARTYASYHAAHADSRWRAVGTDICSTPTCQVYRGLDAERRAAGHGWLAAVEATAGRALMAGDGPIFASYSSTANGPRAMSQNGALAMATEGRSASEILQSYYGLRPTLAPGRLPATIRVALVMSASRVRISSTTGLRVLDGAGKELAVAPAGDWTVVPGGDGVRVVPPDGYQPVAVPVEPEVADAGAVLVRRPGRAVMAAGVSPEPASWGVAAAALVTAAGAATITLGRRRRTLRPPGVGHPPGISVAPRRQGTRNP